MIKGAGLSTGESTELANSYLSRLGRTTRHMTSQGNDDALHAYGDSIVYGIEIVLFYFIVFL